MLHDYVKVIVLPYFFFVKDVSLSLSLSLLTPIRGTGGLETNMSHSFLNSALDGVSGQLHASAVLPRERTADTL